ncbi:MAG: AsmA family protein [Lentisphaerae bacterium]|nr:AsmA family protein [Lentisphaerota bacterium]
MKKILKIALGLLVVLVLLFVVLELFLDNAILKGFNAAAPSALGVPASLDNASLSLLRGRAALEGLHIGNPEGFKTDGLFDLASVRIRLDNASLLTDTIIIREIAIDGLVVTYEKGLLDSNLNALIEGLAGDEAETEDEPAAEEEPAETEKDETPAKKVIIEKLTITGSKMNFSITGAAALTGGGSLPLPLPPITLTDLGKEKEGLTLVEAVQRVLRAIAGAAGTAIAGSAQLIGDTFGAVGDGLWTVGEGAVDAGTAVVGGTVDAGKAVVGGAADAGKAVGGAAIDAGKAVGDTLQNLNPFKD